MVYVNVISHSIILWYFLIFSNYLQPVAGNYYEIQVGFKIIPIDSIAYFRGVNCITVTMTLSLLTYIQFRQFGISEHIKSLGLG